MEELGEPPEDFGMELLLRLVFPVAPSEDVPKPIDVKLEVDDFDTDFLLFFVELGFETITDADDQS